VVFSFHGFFLPVLLSFLFVLSLPPGFPVLPDLVGMDSTVHLYLLILFLLVLPFPALADHSCPLPKQQFLRDHFGALLRAGIVYGAVQEFPLPLGSHGLLTTAVALPAPQGIVSLTQACLKCVVFLAAVLHSCSMHHFLLLLPVLSWSRDRATINMMPAFLINI